MELKEIKQKICDLRFQIEELAEECDTLWKETDNTTIERIADYLNGELNEIAYRLSDLEDTEEETEENTERKEEFFDDWWGELDTMQKCQLANVPYPTEEDGRGENLLEAEDRANRWWNSRTIAQREEIYKDNSDWWDNE